MGARAAAKNCSGRFSAGKSKKKSNLSSDELRRSFEQSKWNRMLKLAHIQVETEKDAREVMEELEQGKEFGEVAKLRSLPIERPPPKVACSVPSTGVETWKSRGCRWRWQRKFSR